MKPTEPGHATPAIVDVNRPSSRYRSEELDELELLEEPLLDELDELELDELLLEDELELELDDELEDEGFVTASPPHPARGPIPRSVAPPDSRMRNSRRSFIGSAPSARSGSVFFRSAIGYPSRPPSTDG